MTIADNALVFYAPVEPEQDRAAVGQKVGDRHLSAS